MTDNKNLSNTMKSIDKNKVDGKLKRQKNLIPFKSRAENGGKIDPNINIKGRPKTFDELRALFIEIANEKVSTGKGKEKKARVEIIGETMSAKDKYMEKFLEYTYGKVPQSVELSSKEDIIVRLVKDED